MPEGNDKTDDPTLRPRLSYREFFKQEFEALDRVGRKVFRNPRGVIFEFDLSVLNSPLPTAEDYE